MFTTTSQRTPDNIKRHLGKAAYIIEGSKELHNRESIPLHIEYDGGSVDVESMITLIFNGETAGKFPLARAASLHDGLLDCVLLRKCNIFSGSVSALKYLLVGNPNDNVMHLRSSKLKITSPLSPLTDMDGQQCVDLPLEVECLKDFLTVVV
jgi:diacylglycerol kinase family enzyme